jgi:G3E family GTPase
MIRLIHKMRLGDNYWAVVFPIDGQIRATTEAFSPTCGTDAGFDDLKSDKLLQSNCNNGFSR